MSVKPQYETYRYIGEVCRLHSQSIVECRLSGSEVSSVLAVHAKAVPADCVCGDGEVNYNGKVELSIVYEDGERKICRVERGAEFFHKAEGSAVSPACFAKAELVAENVSYRREGSGLYISVVVGAALRVYGGKQVEYFVGGEEIISKAEKQMLCKTVCVSGETEGDDEFETEYVGDILLHSENAVVHRVTASMGQIEVEGELNVNICVLRSNDTVCSYERLIPFRMQIPSDEAYGNISASAQVIVKSAHLTAGTDEEADKSKMLLAYTLSADCFLHVKEEIAIASDAFCVENELQLKRAKEGGRYLTKHERYTERVSGTALLSPTTDGEYLLQASVLPRAEIVCRKGERGMEAEGAVLAEVLLCSAEGVHRSATLSLPFLFPIDVKEEIVEADCVVCGLNVRRKKGGETEAEATLKISIRCYEEMSWEYICEASEGEAFERNENAFSVFIPCEGEELWQVAKRLKCPPEDLQKSNPDLKFPISAGKRIFVYRKIK